MRNSKKNNAEISRDIDQIYKGWLDKIGLIVASNERCTDDWEHWFEWKTYFEQGFSPWMPIERQRQFGRKSHLCKKIHPSDK